MCRCFKAVRVSVCCAFCASFAMSAKAASDMDSHVEYVWNAEQPQIEFGEDVTIVLDDSGKISRMDVTSTCGKDVVFSGDEMQFSDNSSIRTMLSNGRTLVFNNAVVADGTLSITNMPYETYAYKGDMLPAATSGVRQVVAPNMKLENVDFLSVQFNMNTISGRGIPCFTSRTENSLETQFQLCTWNSFYVKCVKVRLEQSGEDVVASILYARYTPGKIIGAIDFDDLDVVSSAPKKGEAREYEIATSLDQMLAYGIDEMTLCQNVGRWNVRFTKSVKGPLSISENQCVTVSGEALASWSSQVGGRGGKLVFEGEEIEEGPVQGGRDSKNMPTKVWSLFAPNQRLGEMTFVSARLGGEGIIGSNGNPVEAHICFVENNGRTASAWCQYMSSANDDAKRGTVKGVKLAFKQSGKDVYVCVEKCRYLKQDENRSYRYGVDLENHPSSEEQKNIAGEIHAVGYGVAEFVVSFEHAAPPLTVNLVSGCAFTNGTIRATGGVALVAVPEDSVPPYGIVEVCSGADLAVEYVNVHQNVEYGIGQGLTSLMARPGGRLRLGSMSITTTQMISCDGGRIELEHEKTQDAWCGFYLSDCSLLNGASVVGSYPRVGRYADHSLFKISGNAPSFFCTRLQLLGPTLKNATEPAAVSPSIIEFMVSDVDGDASVDFAVKGGMIDWSNADQGLIVVHKTGDGTMALMGNNTFGTTTKGVFKISEGEMLLSSNGVTHAGHFCHFDGGTLTAASNATNVIGTLEMVSATSRIVMEDGASLAFSAVDSSKWAEGAQLIIEWESVGSSSLRIGSSASALTPGQRSALKGYVPGIDRLLRVLFDENGYARPWMGGMTISIR